MLKDNVRGSTMRETAVAWFGNHHSRLRRAWHGVDHLADVERLSLSDLATE